MRTLHGHALIDRIIMCRCKVHARFQCVFLRTAHGHVCRKIIRVKADGRRGGRRGVPIAAHGDKL